MKSFFLSAFENFALMGAKESSRSRAAELCAVS